jgi:hypothetical protein
MQSRYQLLCEAHGILIPEVDTVDELLDRWAYQLEPPRGAAAA